MTCGHHSHMSLACCPKGVPCITPPHTDAARLRHVVSRSSSARRDSPVHHGQVAPPRWH